MKTPKPFEKYPELMDDAMTSCYLNTREMPMLPFSKVFIGNGRIVFQSSNRNSNIHEFYTTVCVKPC
jgi:hypothetical protein